jgi:hypothetical protein
VFPCHSVASPTPQDVLERYICVFTSSFAYRGRAPAGCDLESLNWLNSERMHPRLSGLDPRVWKDPRGLHPAGKRVEWWNHPCPPPLSELLRPRSCVRNVSKTPPLFSEIPGPIAGFSATVGTYEVLLYRANTLGGGVLARSLTNSPSPKVSPASIPSLTPHSHAALFPLRQASSSRSPRSV